MSFEDHLLTKCPKCGIEQDPEKPVCSHMMGKKGGKIATVGRDMHELGRKGGSAVKAKYGPDFYKAMGAKGGAAVRDKRGQEFYRGIGKMGGEALKKSAPPGYFEEIGAKGGQRMKALCAAGKCALKKGGDDE